MLLAFFDFRAFALGISPKRLNGITDFVCTAVIPILCRARFNANDHKIGVLFAVWKPRFEPLAPKSLHVFPVPGESGGSGQVDER